MYEALSSISLHGLGITFALGVVKGEGSFGNHLQELGTPFSHVWQKQLYAPWQLRSPIMCPAILGKQGHIRSIPATCASIRTYCSIS